MYTGLHYRCEKCGEVYSDADYTCPSCNAHCIVEEVARYSSLEQYQKDKIEQQLKVAYAYYAKAHGWRVSADVDEALLEESSEVGFYLKKALLIFRDAAFNGNPSALWRLATLYQYGIDVEKNEPLAFHLYVAASRGGLGLATCAVGVCYKDGIGTDVDCQEAFNWFKSAVAQGCGEENLADCYIKGLGTNKDASLGISMLYKAASNLDWASFGCQLGDFCENRKKIITACIEEKSIDRRAQRAFLALADMLYAVRLNSDVDSSEKADSFVDELIMPEIVRFMAEGDFLADIAGCLKLQQGLPFDIPCIVQDLQQISFIGVVITFLEQSIVSDYVCKKNDEFLSDLISTEQWKEAGGMKAHEKGVS